MEIKLTLILIALILWLLCAYIFIKYFFKLKYILSSLKSRYETAANPISKVKHTNVEEYLKHKYPNVKNTLLMLGDPECPSCNEELEQLLNYKLNIPVFLMLKFNNSKEYDYYTQSYGSRAEIVNLPDELIESADIHVFPMYMLINNNGEISEKIISFFHLENILLEIGAIKKRA